MSDTAQSAPEAGAEATPLDLTAYTPVVIIRTDTIEGHEYLRGSRHMVDAGMLAALRAAGMILSPPAA